ncbi:1-acyl-sn-glycerol-3-phosphate acyltransferase [Shimia sp. SDUM112013]|uniref:1-acyl-sn-glycerol-3-phosphate acyltransferase n=1 Tax=Shimia sp. SDUM112013 TaxID=3136160 RepID=UPI0032EEEF4D
MDDLLRARLQITEGAALRIKALRMAMSVIDAFNRTFTGQSFFALREVENILIRLDGRQGRDLIQMLLDENGGTPVTPHGLENIPKTGPTIIASTHPVGTFDFVAHAAALMDHRTDIKVVANREAERFLGEDTIIPVDVDKNNRTQRARATQHEMKAHLETGGALLIFGSGRVPFEDKNGYLVEPEWRSGTTRVSAACNVEIVPASANMRNSRHYYRTRNIARFLSGGNEGFARTVASLRYASELFAKLGQKHDVFYGAPLPPGTPPEQIKEAAETLAPGLYRPAPV